jgi:putative ABC transport system substrate-binding protein
VCWLSPINVAGDLRMIRRREFVAGIGGAAAWPFAARAQQGERIRRVGVLIPYAADDQELQTRFAAFRQGMQQLGWADGRNIRIDIRWGAGDANLVRKYAAELVALGPDVLLAGGSGTATVSLWQVTRTVPIVFANVIDPVAGGYVESLARPGGNVTGFLSWEYTLSEKWLELLKEIAPRVTWAAVLRDPTVRGGPAQFAVIQAMAPSLGIGLRPVNVSNAGEIERAITAFAQGANGGLIVTGSSSALIHRELIIALAAQHRLPAVYSSRYFVTGGGLICYGPDLADQWRRAASYVDRILRGEKPADLPVQAPTKYQLVLNMKTAKALGIDVPRTLLARADEVIE